LLRAPLAEAADITQTVLPVAKRNLHDRLYGSTILIAKPIGDERHVGFIINKPTNMTLGKLFPKHRPSQKVIDPVYLGGPMGPEVIFAMVKDAKSPGAGTTANCDPGSELPLVVERGLLLAREPGGKVLDVLLRELPGEALHDRVRAPAVLVIA